MLYLGCPIWTSKKWLGNFLPHDKQSRDSLAVYSRRLNMVEGNTTFYGMPNREIIERWRDDTPYGFKFCLKFPRVISHDLQLNNCEIETEEWIDRLRLLGDRAGVSFLQLPRDFAPNKWPILRKYLESLPPDLCYAVEPRHPAWFLEKPEKALDDLLHELSIARVLYDVRPLLEADSSDPNIAGAQRSKPKVPVRTTRTAKHTLVRYISHPILPANDQWLSQWEKKVAEWLSSGHDIYFCMHSIYDEQMPLLCKIFYHRLEALNAPLPAFPNWPVSNNAVQMSLF